MTQGFRGPQVCDIVGVSYRQLDYWTRTGLIEASVAPAKGSGTQRLYSYRDVVEVKVIKSLLDAEVSLQGARRAVEYLREHLGEELASASLVIDGKSVLAVSDGELVDLLHRGQGVLNVIPLAGVTRDLDAKIHELRPETVDAGAAGEAEAAEPGALGGMRAAGGG